MELTNEVISRFFNSFSAKSFTQARSPLSIVYCAIILFGNAETIRETIVDVTVVLCAIFPSLTDHLVFFRLLDNLLVHVFKYSHIYHDELDEEEDHHKEANAEPDEKILALLLFRLRLLIS